MIERKRVSDDGYDLCISCEKKTKYPTNTPIDKRYNYIEGAGQLCNECYHKIFKTFPEKENKKKITINSRYLENVVRRVCKGGESK